MKRFSSLVFLLSIISCGHNVPNPNPTPIPIPVPTPLPQLLIRQTNPPRLVRDGIPFTPFGAIACCMEYKPQILAKGGKSRPPRPKPFSPFGVRATCNTLWPLASECWMDYTKSRGANFFHFRMGPFYGDEAHEIEWSEFGGPYLSGPGTDWNYKFWDKFKALLLYAQKLGANVEVNVIDTWYCKHAQWGDQEMPWPKEDYEACGRRPSPEQEKYIRKVVDEAKDFPNVVWITDNEGGAIQGDNCSWFEWVRNVIRDQEAKSGGAIRMVGTNNPTCANGPFDYIATHERAPLLNPISGKHTSNNERNPQFSPEQEYSNFCKAQERGLHYWFWRAGMNDADFERTLQLFSQGCSGPQQCFAPVENDPLWGANIPGPGQKRAALENAKLVVGNRCGTIPPHEAGLATLDELASVLRQRGECASRSADSVFILANDGWWEEYHAVSFATGCWANNNDVLPKFRWKYNGTNPTPTVCKDDVPTVDQIGCRLHQAYGLYDCTPKADGRPIRPEGDPQRIPCELKAMGGEYPVYNVRSDTLTIFPEANPMQFLIKGRGTGFVTCKVPAVNGTLCNLEISR